MSDNPDITDDNDGNDSIWTNLKNKISYTVHNATSDPNANKFAAERTKKKKEDEIKKENANNKGNTTDDNNNADPNSFSAKRLAKKVGNQTLDILKRLFVPFVALMLAMIVVNEMIIYSVPIRIIFFIFTFLVCYFAQKLRVILSIFYILKGSYSYYVNNMTDRPKKDIMPTIYALLPITTYKPTSSFWRFLYYPFTYPKSDIAAVQLPKTMEKYWNDLQESFKDLDKVSNLPIFADELKIIQKQLVPYKQPEPVPITPNSVKN